MLKNLIKCLFIIFIVFNHSLDAKSFENRIVFKINNEIITSIDIKNELNYLTALNPKILELEKNEIFEIAKNSIIREKIKKIELKKRGVDFKIDPNLFNKIIEQRYKNIGLSSEKEFLKYLKQFNLKTGDLEEKIAIEALWNELIIVKFRSKVKIDKDKITMQIKNNNNSIIKTFNISEILFELKNKESLDYKYNKIKKTIDEKGFENAASIFSISNSSDVGGKIGWIKESSLNKKLIYELTQLKDKSYTKPFAVPGGFLILKLNETKEIKEKINFEKEIKKTIMIQTNKQLNQFSNIYFNKIKKNIKIEKI